MSFDFCALRRAQVALCCSTYAIAILAAHGCRADPDTAPQEGSTTSAGDSSVETSSTSTIAPADSSSGSDDGTTGGSESTTESTTEATTESTTESTAESTTEDIPAICGDGISVPGELCFGDSQYISRTESHKLALADVNDDGILDLLTSRDYSFAILLGQGDGTFVQLDAVLSPEPVRHFLFHDFDGDGTLDLATAHGEDDSVRIHLGVGDGLFGPHTEWTFGNPWGLAAGDFDGDGAADIAVAERDIASLGMLYGNGDGTFESERINGWGMGLWAVAVDLDGRGPIDLAMGNTLKTFLGGPDGLTFDDVQLLPAHMVFAADFDDDGRDDIATVSRFLDEVHLLHGVGDGSLELGFSGVLGDIVYDANCGDFDRDGRPDLAMTLISEDEIAVLRSDVPGSLSLELGPRISTVVEPRAVAVGDVNGDGADDIVVGSTARDAMNTGIAVILNEP